MSNKCKYIEIRKILDILETLPSKKIEYDIYSDFSLKLLWYTEDGNIEIKIIRGYKPLININWKETFTPLDCMDLRIEKLKEMFEIMNEICKRLDFIEDEDEEE